MLEVADDRAQRAVLLVRRTKVRESGVVLDARMLFQGPNKA
jgi:hypothetical protein